MEKAPVVPIQGIVDIRRIEIFRNFSNPLNSAAISGQFFDNSCPWTSGREQKI